MSNGFQKNAFQVVKEGQEDILKIDCRAAGISPSLEDDPVTMMLVTEKLVEFPGVKRINLYLNKNYSYNYHQTQLLVEIANVYNALVRQRKIWGLILDQGHASYLGDRLKNLQNLVYGLIKSDPIGAFVEIKRLRRESRIKLKNGENNYEKDYYDFTDQVYNLIKNTGLINQTREELEGYELGDRGVYRLVFRPSVTPDFMFSRLQAQPPMNAEQIDIYTVGDADIGIYKIPEEIKYLYQLNPPEFKLTEEEYALLDVARGIIREHQPSEEDFLEPERVRATFFNISKDLVTELADQKGIELSLEKLNVLSEILVRYTVGFGLIEVLLDDEKIQDITINSPAGESPIFIVHQDYGHCFTNITSSSEDVQGWATKFRILSGRALDEANPILDTELILPRSRARVAIITAPLNPYGIGYAFRRHRDKPWTLPLFIKNKMMNSMAAGLLSFIIDGNRTLLFCGTRSSGKTSVLGASITEIMRRYRILSVEDTLELPMEAFRKLGYNVQPMKVRSALASGGTELSADEGIRTSLRMGDSALIVGEVRSSIRGDENVIIIERGETKRIPIRDLEGKNIENIYVPTLDFDLKVKLSKLTGFVKHPKRNLLLKVKTRTGREITVTPDHSLFTSHNFKVYPIECKALKVGCKIVLPSRLPCGYNDIEYFNLLEILPEFHLVGAEPYIRRVIKKLGGRKSSELVGGYDVFSLFSKKRYRFGIGPVRRIKASSFLKLMGALKCNYNIDDLKIKNITSNTLPAKFSINEDFCRFLGYYLSEGWIEGNSVVVSNINKTIVNDVKDLCCRLFFQLPNLRVGKTSLGQSLKLIIPNSPLTAFFKRFGLNKKSFEKRIPWFVFGLNKSKICSFLKGLYLGDGSFSGTRMEYATTSKNLAEDLVYLLLTLGIVAKVTKKKQNKDAIGKRLIYNVEFARKEDVRSFIQTTGFDRGKIIFEKKKDLAISRQNVITFDRERLDEHIITFKKEYSHLKKYLRCSKFYLNKLIKSGVLECDEALKNYVMGEFYLDEVNEIEEIHLNKKEHVYDLSVEPSQNFIGGFGGILLHNTEARALYEAMRVGSLANTVAGTIHGESPYGVFDRVVNDLNVPKTSFKATDLIVLSNPIRSPDGLSYVRRILQITEVRKHWQDDPLKEGGFMDLMKYNPKTDQLEITDDLRNGDSELLKSIASNVKEWAGNWEAVWDNILLRAKIKQTLVDYSINTGRPELLEADFVVRANDMFHIILESVKSETGYLNSEKIYNEWVSWLEKNSKIKE